MKTNETENGNGTSKGGLSFINKKTSKELCFENLIRTNTFQWN